MEGAGADWGQTMTVACNSVGLAIDLVQHGFMALGYGFVAILDEMLAGARLIDDFTPFHPFREDINAAQDKLNGWRRSLESGLFANQAQIEGEWKALGDAIDDVPDTKEIAVTAATAQAKQDL